MHAAAPNPWIGRPLRRKEDPRLLRGEAVYLPDVSLPGMLHAAFVRSPHAHALIRRIETERARRVEGVAAVLTAADLTIHPIEAALNDARYHGGRWPAPAADRVRFAGEAVAVVVAADRYTAEDAAEQVEVDYEILPAIVDIEAALRPGTIALHDDVPQNTFLVRELSHADVAPIFSHADVVVRGTFRHQRMAGAPMEGRGVAAAWDERGRLAVYASTQAPHSLLTGLARGLRLAETDIRVIVPEVGGGFGPKMHLYPEDLVVCAAARHLRRPVKWVEDRRENLLTMTQAREQVVEAEAAADRDGRILALRARILCDCGAYSAFPATAALEPVTTATILPGPYRIPAYAYTALAVATNKAPTGAYRGVGMTTGAFVMERLMDDVAAATGLDPAEMRRRNFIPPDAFPYATASGLVYDSGRYAETLDAAVEAFDYAQARRRQHEMRREGRLVGIGLCAFTEFTGMGSRTYARRGMSEMRGYDGGVVRIDAAGRIDVALSCPSQGQGHETAFAQLVAGELGADPAQVRVLPVDTDTAPAGSGTFASRALVSGGGALIQAAERVRVKAVAIAAHLLEASPADVVVEEGRFFVRGAAARAISWADVARAAYVPGAGWIGDGREPGLEASVTYDPPPAAFGNGAHAAMVEVDRETGEARVLCYVIAGDCGPMLNPMIVEGQSHGGLAQGVGEALYEELRFDEDGQPLTATFMDYLVPTAMEMPAVRVVHLETPSPYTFRGFKGVGESAAIGAPACLANALSDALRRPVDTLPVTPVRVLEWLSEGRTVPPPHHTVPAPHHTVPAPHHSEGPLK